MEDALATVLQTQANMEQNLMALAETQPAFLAQMAEMRAVADRRWTETLERDAVREKIGFRGTA